MKIYKPTYPLSAGNLAWKIFIEWYWILLIIFILYNFSPLAVSFRFMVIYLPISFAIDICRQTTIKYINELGINLEERFVYFRCYIPGIGNKEFTRSFDELKVEIVQYQRPKCRRNPVIYFFKNKPANFYLSAQKDHFSKKDMTEIADLLESLTVAVNRK